MLTLKTVLKHKLTSVSGATDEHRSDSITEQLSSSEIYFDNTPNTAYKPMHIHIFICIYVCVSQRQQHTKQCESSQLGCSPLRDTKLFQVFSSFFISCIAYMLVDL